MPLPRRLMEGYESFRSGRYALEAERYRRLGEGQQTPSIMMIACCDSRAAPETVFDAGPGEIFVVRNVANLVPPSNSRCSPWVSSTWQSWGMAVAAASAP